MRGTHRMPGEPTLGAELRSSALLFGLAIGCTAGVVTVAHLALRLAGG